MSTDSRYMYQTTQQGLPSQYDYSYPNPHPHSNYDNSPLPQPPPSVRPMRSSSSISSQPPPHSPHQPQYPPPSAPSPYPPTPTQYSSQGHYITHAPPAPASAPPPPQQSPPQSQQQWSNENWPPPPQYSHSTYPNHVNHHQHQHQHQPPPQSHPPPSSHSAPSENLYESGPGRPDTSPALSTSDSSTRGYDERSSVHTQHSHPPPPPLNGTSMRSTRRREDDSPTSYTASQPSSPNAVALDFNQLGKHVKFIESSVRDSLQTLRGPPHPDMLEQMMHFATYAAQMLDSAAGISHPTAPPLQHQNQQVTPATVSQGYARSSPKQREAEQIKQHQSPRSQANGASPSLQNSSMSVKRPKNEESQSLQGHTPIQSQTHSAPTQDGQTCLGCNATSTPEWRRGPMGPRTLCNACGLVYAKLIKKRDRERARAAGKVSAQGNGHGGSASQGADDSDPGDSDDDEAEDDYASGTSVGRSEIGDYRRE